MAFTVKDWKDAPLTTTPLSAAAMEDLETRLSNYVDAQGGEGFNVKAYGAVGDGVIDDTSAFNAAITAASAAGGGTVFMPPTSGGYGITADANVINLVSNVTIQGSGYPGRIVRIGAYEKGAGRRIFSALDTTNGVVNSTLRDIYIDGKTSLVTLTSTTLAVASTLNAPTITVGSTAAFPTSGEFMLNGVACAHTGKTANTLTGCTNVPVAPIGTTVYESVGNLTAQAIRYYPLDENEHHVNVRIEGCTIVDWPGAALHLDDAERFTVQGNIVRNAQRGGLILFHDCHDGIINDNIVHSADDCIAIQANSNVAATAKGPGPARITISNNSCESFGIPNQFTNNNLNIQGLSDSTISGNTCTGAGESGGGNKSTCRISLSDGTTAAARYRTKRLNIVGNFFYSPDDHGVYISGDSTVTEPIEDVHIKDNLFVDAGQVGILVEGYVNRLSVTGNSVEGSNSRNSGAFDGIRLVDAHNFLVSDNQVTDRSVFSRFGINVGPACTLGEVKNNICPDNQTTTRGFNNDTTNVLFANNETRAFATIASTATVTLRDGYSFHHITGTTTITSITAQAVGQEVTLIFAAALTVTDGLNLSLSGNFVTTPGATLTLVSDGTNWIEISRSPITVGSAFDPNAVPKSLVDVKGDLMVATANDTLARLGVGANDQILTADSATATGTKWATPAGSNGPRVNVHDYGAVGDGTTNDSAAFTAAIAAAGTLAGSTGRATVFCRSGTVYRLVATVTNPAFSLPSGVTLNLQGSTLDFATSTTPFVYAFGATGTVPASGVGYEALSANAAYGSYEVNCVNEGEFVDGDWVKLASEGDEGASTGKVGEINRVVIPKTQSAALTIGATTIDIGVTTANLFGVTNSGGGRVQIDSELIDYTAAPLGTGQLTGCTRGVGGSTAATHAAGATVTFVPANDQVLLMWPIAAQHGYLTADTAFIKKITPVENVGIRNGKMLGPGFGRSFTGVWFRYCINAKIIDVDFVDVNQQCTLLANTVYGRVEGCSMYKSTLADPATANLGYGVILTDASQDCTITNNYITRMRHCVAHGQAEYGHPRRNIFAHNHFLYSSGDLFDTHVPTDDVHIIGNTFVGGNIGVVLNGPRSTIIGNHFEQTASSAINLNYAWEAPKQVKIQNNKIIRPDDGYGILITGDSAAGSEGSDFIHISGNDIDCGTRSAITLGYASGLIRRGVSIEGNVIANSPISYAAIEAGNLEGAIVSNNIINDPHINQRGILLANSNKSSVTGNVINYASVGTGIGIDLDNCDDITLTGNAVRNGGTGINLQNDTDHCRVANNSLRGCTTTINHNGIKTHYGQIAGPMTTVPSAATVTLPDEGEAFDISGTTTITSVTASWAGRRVTLRFTGNCQVTDGSNLRLNGNFISVGTNDDTLTLVSDMTNWYEVARSNAASGSGILPTIVDAKGDIIAATGADAVSRLAVGPNNQVLTADSATATGLKWAAGGGGGGSLQTLSDVTGAPTESKTVPTWNGSAFAFTAEGPRINVHDYGAIGDNVALDNQAFIDALAAAGTIAGTTGSCTVYCRPGARYKLTGGNSVIRFLIPPGVTLDLAGATCDFSTSGDFTQAFGSQGSAAASGAGFEALTADALYQKFEVNCANGNEFVDGDWVLLTAEDDDGTGTFKKGEICRVVVPTGNCAAMDATQTTITLGATGGNLFSNTNSGGGRVQIDSELIDYTAAGIASITGCTRGVGGSTAATHAVGSNVTFVPSATQVLFMHAIVGQSNYEVANGAALRKLNMISDVGIQNGKIIGPGNVGGKAFIATKFQYCANVKVEDVHFEDCNSIDVSLSNAVFAVVNRCWIYKSLLANPASANLGYGILLSDATQDCTISNNHILRCRHCISHGNANWGYPRRNVFVGNHFLYASGDNVDTHSPTDDIHFVGNVIMGGSNGIVLRCPKATIVGNHFQFTNGPAIQATYVHNTRNQWKFQDNKIISSKNSVGIVVNGDNVPAGQGNDFIQITGNAIKCGAQGGISFGDSGVQRKGVQISGNVVTDCPNLYDAIDIANVDGAVISNNVVLRTHINRSAFEFTNVNRSSVIGNSVDYDSIGTGTAYSFINCDDLTIVGNTANNAATGINLANTCTYAHVSSNNTRNCSNPMNLNSVASHVLPKGHTNHGAVASAERPQGFRSVEWVGSVEPTNAIDGDTWVNTS